MTNAQSTKETHRPQQIIGSVIRRWIRWPRPTTTPRTWPELRRRRLLAAMGMAVGMVAAAPLIAAWIAGNDEPQRSTPRGGDRPIGSPPQYLGPGSPRELPLIAARLYDAHDLAG